MSADNTKSLEVSNADRINDMILRFRLCADAASELSNSVEKFTGIYSNIEKNVIELKEIESNINSNEYIKGLLDATTNMKDIFDYFNSNIPELSKSMQSSKKELDSYKDEFQFVSEYYKDLPNQIDNVTEKIKSMLNDHLLYNKKMLDELQGFVDDISKKVESQYTKTRKKTVEDIKKQLDTGLEDFKKETMKQINESVDRVISEKVKLVLVEFNNIAKNFPALSNKQNFEPEIDTIYNLYTRNNKKLPIYVRRTTWSENFYFKVNSIEEDSSNGFSVLTAHGIRFKVNDSYDNFHISAHLEEFKLYNFQGTDIAVDMALIDDGDISFL